MPNRDQVCTQYPHCLSCPLSIAVTGKDCRTLSKRDVDNIMSFVRELEAVQSNFNLVELFEYIRRNNK